MNAPILVPLDGETDALQIAIKELSRQPALNFVGTSLSSIFGAAVGRIGEQGNTFIWRKASPQWA
jgi:hypothetical protein